MDLSKLFTGLGNTVSNIATGIGNDFSSGVQNFQQQAGKLLAPQPQIPTQAQNQLPPPPAIGEKSTPLFVQPQQNPQVPPIFNSPLAPTPDQQNQKNPFDTTLPPNAPVAPDKQPQVQAPQPGTDQDALNQAMGVLEHAALGIAAGVWNPIADAFNNTYSNIQKAQLANRGNPLQAALSSTGALAQGTIGNPRLLADEASLAIGGPELGSIGADALAQGGIRGALRAGLQNVTNPAVLGEAMGAFGTAGGLGAYANTDPNQTAQQQALQTAQGIVGGAWSAPAMLFGGPLAGAAVRKIAQKVIPIDDFAKYGGQFATPEGQQAVLGKIQGAVQNQPDFQNSLENVAQGIGGRAVSNVKSPTSIIGKVIGHIKSGEQTYSVDDVGDVLRGSVVMPDQKALDQTVTAVKQEAQNKGWTLDPEQEENFFAKPGPNNYQGYHLNFQLPDGTKSEVQIHTPESYANARLTHDTYSDYGDNAPPIVKRQIGKIQSAIDKQNPQVVDNAVKSQEAKELPNTLSPMEKDFTPQKTIGQMQQEHQDPDLTKYENALNGGDVKTLESLASQHPDDARYQIHQRLGLTSQAGKLQAQRDTLQAVKTNSDQIPHDIQRQQNRLGVLKQQLQAAKTAARGAPAPTRLALQAERDRLQAAHDDLNATVKSRLQAHRANIKEQNARIDQTTKDLDNQIGQAQGQQDAQDAIKQQLTPNQESFATGQPSITQEKPFTDEQKEQVDMPTLRSDEDMLANGHTTQFQATGKNNALQRKFFPSVLGRLKNATDMRVRKLGFGLQEAHSWGLGRGQNAAYNLSQLRQEFTPQESINATEVLEGKAPAISPRVQQWTDAARNESNQLFQAARRAGIPVQYLQDYFPHTYTQDTIDQIARDKDFQNAVIKAKLASNPAEAEAYLRNSGGRISPREVGALHEHRLDTTNKYPYVKDPRVMEEYLKNAYNEVGFSSAFGPGMRKFNGMYNAILKNNPEEAKAVKSAFQLAGALKGDAKTPSGELQTDFFRGLRNFNTVTSLSPGTSPLSHVPALGHAATRLGVGNTLKALGTLPRALVGKYTPEQLRNVTRYTQDNTAQLYGSNGGKIMQKFYKLTGIPWTLDKISAVVHDAAQSRLQQISQNLNSPDTKADLLKAGLNYNKILRRGSLSPSEQYQYVNEALRDSSLELSGLDMPEIAQSSIGKLAMQLTGPEQLSLRRFAPYAGERLLNGSPGAKASVLGGLALTAGLGVATQEGKNLLANKPAQPLSTTAEQGVAQATGIPGASQTVESLQYPEFNIVNTGNPLVDTAGTAAINTLGGPTLGKAQNATQIATNLGGTPAQRTLALRTLTRNTPLVGTPLANTFFPSASYKGNRPTDQIGGLLSGQPVTHQTGALQYNTPASIADIFRQNPQVAQAQGNQAQGYANIDKAVSQLDAGQQANYKAIQQQQAAGTPQAYKNIDGLYLQDFGQNSSSKLWNVAQTRAQANAKMYNMPVEPQYALSQADAKAYLQYETASPQQQVQLSLQNPNLLETERQQSIWEQNPAVQQYKAAIAQQYGQTYTPPIANPLYQNDANGKPVFSNADIAARNAILYYNNSNPPQTAQADQLKANYPYAQMELATAPYEAQKLQQAYTTWAKQNPGSNWQDFAQQQYTQNGYFPNMAGVDPNGNILPAYDIHSEPPYQLYEGTIPSQFNVPVPQTPQQANQMSTVANLYTAMSKSGLTQVTVNGQTVTKKGLEAANNWLPNYWNYEAAYYQANPVNSNTYGQAMVSGGNGIQFGSASGSGGSGGYGSSGSSMSYLQRELVYQAMAEARSRIQVPKVNLSADQKNTHAILAKPINTNLVAGPKGQSVFATAPKLTLNAMPKLTKYKVASNLGRLQASPGPRPKSIPASPGRQQQIKLT